MTTLTRMTRMTRGDVSRIVREARERGEHLDLSGLDLRGVNLRGVNLVDADLRGADLRHVDLRGLDLRGADLRGANLHGAALHGAHLCDARWDGLAIDGLHPHRILLTPTADGWWMSIGCWFGTPDELQELIDGDDWPDAVGVEITRRRPLLEAALCVVDAHIAAHPDVIDDLKERWTA